MTFEEGKYIESNIIIITTSCGLNFFKKIHANLLSNGQILTMSLI